MTENLGDLQVGGIESEGDARTTLGSRGFTGVRLDLRSVEV
jgi:hypothetical protein